MTGWQSAVLDFWFGLEPEAWWNGNADLDEEIRDRFADLWQEQRQFPASHFLDSPRSALAAVILFDQFPRNMFRGHADQFSTDPLALQIAKGAIARDQDQQLQARERAMLYMPFQHSEDRDDQRQSLILFGQLGDDTMLDYARRHQAIVERFGRFPHRNAMLGRAPRAEEVAAGDVTPF